MRSILEKAFYSLLNQEKDKADALVHEFMIERARQIHESLRQGEDFVLDESWEQELSIDEMFSEADLVEDEEENVEGDDTSAGDESEDQDADPADAEGDDLEVDDADDGAEGEELPIEDRVSELEAELQRLAAVFDAELGTGEAEEVVGDDMADDELNMDGDEDEVVEGDLEITQSDDGALSMTHDVDGLGDDDFESLGESALSELEKVSAPANTEGKYLQDGKATVNTKSPTLSKPVEQRQAGEPVKIKSSTHSGYDREAAPKTADMKARQNTMKKADAKQSSVSKEGDKSALINDGKEDKTAQHSLFDKKHK